MALGMNLLRHVLAAPAALSLLIVPLAAEAAELNIDSVSDYSATLDLEQAKQLGDFLYVGIWDDDMVRYYKGEVYPIQALQERILMTLACKHVDDVVIGAPFMITSDLI